MSRQKNKTTIALKKETVDQLKLTGRKGQTYDDIVQALLKKPFTAREGLEDAATREHSTRNSLKGRR